MGFLDLVSHYLLAKAMTADEHVTISNVIPYASQLVLVVSAKRSNEENYIMRLLTAAIMLVCAGVIYADGTPNHLTKNSDCISLGRVISVSLQQESFNKKVASTPYFILRTTGGRFGFAGQSPVNKNRTVNHACFNPAKEEVCYTLTDGSTACIKPIILDYPLLTNVK